MDWVFFIGIFNWFFFLKIIFWVIFNLYGYFIIFGCKFIEIDVKCYRNVNFFNFFVFFGLLKYL